MWFSCNHILQGHPKISFPHPDKQQCNPYDIQYSTCRIALSAPFIPCHRTTCCAVLLVQYAYMTDAVPGRGTLSAVQGFVISALESTHRFRGTGACLDHCHAQLTHIRRGVAGQTAGCPPVGVPGVAIVPIGVPEMVCSNSVDVCAILPRGGIGRSCCDCV